jgi:hypothetical protein
MKLKKLGSVEPEYFAVAGAKTGAAKRRDCGEEEGPQKSDQAKSSSVSVNCFLCFGGRFRLSGMTRVAAGAIPDLRAARRTSVPLSKIFFRFLIPALGRDSTGFRN